jgi:hypothetical protein
MQGIRRMAVATFALFAYAAGCDTHAVGIDECRAIELERCRAARSCNLGLALPDAEIECERFSQDNCLHGLPTPSAPRPTDLQRCVAVIHSAGVCARKSGAETRADDCGLAGTFSPANATVCEVIQAPEEASECAFLLNQAVPDTTPPTDAGAD